MIIALTPAGTPLGDPIEVGAIAAVLLRRDSSGAATATGDAAGVAGAGSGAAGGAPLLMTTAKSQLGHAEPAAGMVGLLRLRAQVGRRPPAPFLKKLYPLLQCCCLPVTACLCLSVL